MALENIGAERGLISVLIKEPSLVFTVDEFLQPSDFSDKCYSNLYRIVKSLALDNSSVVVDDFLLRTKASELNLIDFDDVYDIEMYNALQISPVDGGNLNTFIKSVRSCSIKRRLDQILVESRGYVRETEDNATSVISQLESNLLGYVDSINNRDNQARQGGEGFLEWVNAIADAPDEHLWPTCYPRYDKMVGMARRNALHVISARPKTGKSYMGMNIAINMALQGIPVLITDTELTFDQWRLRFAGYITKIPINIIETGLWKGNESYITKINRGYEIMRSLPIFHKEVIGLSVEEIISAMRSWLYTNVGFQADGTSNRCVFVHDYIKMHDEVGMKAIAEYQALGFACTKLKDFAAKYQTCIYSFAQLNREGGIAASDRINWYASSVASFRAKTLEEMEADGPERGNRVMKVQFSRHGEPHGDDDELFFHFDGAIGHITEDKNRSEMVNEMPSRNRVQ